MKKKPQSINLFAVQTNTKIEFEITEKEMAKVHMQCNARRLSRTEWQRENANERLQRQV